MISRRGAAIERTPGRTLNSTLLEYDSLPQLSHGFQQLLVRVTPETAAPDKELMVSC